MDITPTPTRFFETDFQSALDTIVDSIDNNSFLSDDSSDYTFSRLQLFNLIVNRRLSDDPASFNPFDNTDRETLYQDLLALDFTDDQIRYYFPYANLDAEDFIAYENNWLNNPR